MTNQPIAFMVKILLVAFIFYTPMKNIAAFTPDGRNNSTSYHSSQITERQMIEDMIIAEARANGTVPPALALGVARVESNFDPDALSTAGARGIMQIMPQTARGVFRIHPDRLWDPQLNIRLGIRYLAKLYNRYGSWEAALSHYNGGSLKKRHGVYVPHGYTRKYVANVIKHSIQYERDWTYDHLQARQKMLAAAQDGSPDVKRTMADLTPAEQAAQRQAALDGLYNGPEPGVADWRHYNKVSSHFLTPDEAELYDLPSLSHQTTNWEASKWGVNKWGANAKVPNWRMNAQKAITQGTRPSKAWNQAIDTLGHSILQKING